MRLYYCLKKKAHRELVELTTWSESIAQGICRAMGENLVPNSVRVEKNQFSFEVYFEPTNSSLRKMGEHISFIRKEIRNYVTTYGRSRQLFHRVK